MSLASENLIRDETGGKGDFVFVTPGNCEKIIDPQVADSCRSCIWGMI